jgi:putative (di)nucleoside polyphosphate hydrolase
MNMDNQNLPIRQAVGGIIICKTMPNQIIVVKKVLREDIVNNEKVEELDIPKGGIRLGESSEKAILRELEEELGTNKLILIQKLPFNISFDFPLTNTKYKGQITTLFLLEYFGKPDELKPRTAEIKEAYFIPIQTAESILTFKETKEAIKKAKKLEFI